MISPHRIPTDCALMDRTLGALYGLAIGDALGMPTQLLSAPEIARKHGTIEGFQAPLPDHPIAAKLPAGSITDDTEQALLLAETLIAGRGRIDPQTWTQALIDWEADARARGSLDLLGPSTQRALKAIKAGVDPREAGKEGDTNGAAMRIAPVGIAMPPEPLESLVDVVAQSCLPTHNTGLAIAGAAAVAATVSAGVAGADWQQASRIAAQAARLGAARGNWIAGADIAARIEWAQDRVAGLDREDGSDIIRNLIGTSVATQESVPAAFAVLCLTRGDPWQAGLLSAGLGGDCDTIAAIACAMAGACAGAAALPATAIDAVRRVNALNLSPLAQRLLDLRAPDANPAIDPPGHAAAESAGQRS